MLPDLLRIEFNHYIDLFFKSSHRYLLILTTPLLDPIQPSTSQKASTVAFYDFRPPSTLFRSLSCSYLPPYLSQSLLLCIRWASSALWRLVAKAIITIRRDFFDCFQLYPAIADTRVSHRHHTSISVWRCLICISFLYLTRRIKLKPLFHWSISTHFSSKFFRFLILLDLKMTAVLYFSIILHPQNGQKDLEKI